MSIDLFQVDAFSDRPFSGNPAAVCLLAEPQDDRWLQSVAQEMNLSETAFLLPEAEGYRLRWFTPTTEVDLCGHATLASAHVLWSEGRWPPSAELPFFTRSGTLIARYQPAPTAWIELDFPTTPATPITAPTASVTALVAALGVEPQFIGQSAFDYLIEVEAESIVRQLMPDLAALGQLPGRGVIVTCRGSQPIDFISRFFAPAAGIAEDPVTGSAHCCLSAFWYDRLGKTEFLAYQASARGGYVKVRYGGDRTYLAGQAVTVLRAKLLA